MSDWQNTKMILDNQWKNTLFIVLVLVSAISLWGGIILGVISSELNNSPAAVGQVSTNATDL